MATLVKTKKAAAKKKITSPDTSGPTAKQFIDALKSHQSNTELTKNQRFYQEDSKNKLFGIRMKTLFDTARRFIAMPLNEVDKLFDDPYYEVRMGAVSIMDYRARRKNISESEQENLFKLYIRRHNRINNWDLVDRSAPHVVGRYLADKPRAILYKLAKSKDVWERRTSIVSTWFFIRQNDINDTFKIAEILVDDKHDMIHKAVGSWIREAGKRDRQMLIDFLDRHASKMPRIMLRYAIEKLDKKQRDYYLKKS